MHLIVGLLFLLCGPAVIANNRSRRREKARREPAILRTWEPPVRRFVDESHLIGRKAHWSRRGFVPRPDLDVGHPCPSPACNYATDRIRCHCLQCGGLGHGYGTWDRKQRVIAEKQKLDEMVATLPPVQRLEQTVKLWEPVDMTLKHPQNVGGHHDL